MTQATMAAPLNEGFLYDLCYAAFEGTYHFLGRLSEKVFTIASTVFTLIAEFFNSPQQSSMPLPPEQTDAPPREEPAEPRFTLPHRNPLIDAFAEFRRGNIQTRNQDADANLNFLYTLTFRRLNTSVPEKMENLQSARAYCARRLISVCVMLPNLLPAASQLPDFVFHSYSCNGRTFIGMMAALQMQYLALPYHRLLPIKSRFDLGTPFNPRSQDPEEQFLKNAHELIDRFLTGNPPFVTCADAVRNRYLIANPGDRYGSNPIR